MTIINSENHKNQKYEKHENSAIVSGFGRQERIH